MAIIATSGVRLFAAASACALGITAAPALAALAPIGPSNPLLTPAPITNIDDELAGYTLIASRPEGYSMDSSAIQLSHEVYRNNTDQTLAFTFRFFRAYYTSTQINFFTFFRNDLRHQYELAVGVDALPTESGLGVPVRPPSTIEYVPFDFYSSTPFDSGGYTIRWGFDYTAPWFWSRRLLLKTNATSYALSDAQVLGFDQSLDDYFPLNFFGPVGPPIPAPASAGLVGLALLAAARRRR
jgi:hypothetical protein